MRLLFICKRHPQQRDLIERPYGRFHWLPTHLAAMGHTVAVATCSYRRLLSLETTRDAVTWSSDDILALGPSRFMRTLASRADAFAPDWLIGCSDAWFGPLARKLAKRADARVAIDAYDNFEAYMPWNLPLHVAWRHAVGAADVVTAAGPQLAGLLQRSRRDGRRAVDIVPMAADPAFVPHDRRTARQALGLPADAPLVGYMGGWATNRGTDVLLDAFLRIRMERPEARLILTGRPPDHALATEGVLALGYVDDAQLPFVLCSLDVACVVATTSAFGRHSYPAKLCEAMACGVPVVATATEPVRWMLGDDPASLAPPGDATAIAERVLQQLRSATPPPAYTCSWGESARRFRAALLGVS